MNRKTTALIAAGIILVGVGGFFSLNMASGETGPGGGDYCAKPDNGKMEVMHNGKALNSEVKLNNGTEIKTDGTVIMKDGSQLTLKENQCIDKDGALSLDEKDKGQTPQGEIPEDEMSKDKDQTPQ